MPAHEDNPARITLVEDSAADVLLLRHALNQHKRPFELEVLKDGAEALAFVHKQRQAIHKSWPSVMVLDLHLPKHDGLAVLTALQESPALQHVRVVALSSFVSPRDEAEVRSLGVRMYREKPDNLDGWTALAHEILEICHEPLANEVVSA